MPHIPKEYLDLAVYIYATKARAERGEPETTVGGSGFLVGVPFSFPAPPGHGHLYAVTCAHVVEDLPVSYLRVNNTHTGLPMVEAVAREGWFVHPDGADVAVAPLDFDDSVGIIALQPELFLTQEIVDRFAVGLGDETFTVGRFVNHEGKQKNVPTVRFGNISMMPSEPVQAERRSQISYLVETRSQSRYSGSPVFVYLTPGMPRFVGDGPQSHFLTGQGPWCLGITWCYLNSEKPNTFGHLQDFQTGLTGVLPIKRLEELLATEAVVNARTVGEKAYRERHPDHESPETQ